MIKCISKTESIREQALLDGRLILLDRSEDIEATMKMNKCLEEVRRGL